MYGRSGDRVLLTKIVGNCCVLAFGMYAMYEEIKEKSGT